LPATTIEDRLRKRLGDGLLTQEPMRHHTTLRIGGPAEYYFAAQDEHQLVEALRSAHELDLPLFLLGGGSNALVSDEGFHGLVICNEIEGIEFDGTAAQIGCGTDFLELIQTCRDQGLSGLEFAAGIPGSVGGALYGNAAATDRTLARS
jgi:UDP-N-acetylmuramate dehydrogenase